MERKNQRQDYNKKKPEEYDYKDIAILGKVFLDAAKKCNEPKIEDIGWSHHLIVPIITNMVFACELFFKAILKYENKLIRTHELVDLFYKLSDESKRKIVDSVNEEEFLCKLINVSNLFQEWRYLYERYPSSIEYVFLQELSEKLLVIVDDL